LVRVERTARRAGMEECDGSVSRVAEAGTRDGKRQGSEGGTERARPRQEPDAECRWVGEVVVLERAAAAAVQSLLVRCRTHLLPPPAAPPSRTLRTARSLSARSLSLPSSLAAARQLRWWLWWCMSKRKREPGTRIPHDQHVASLTRTPTRCDLTCLARSAPTQQMRPTMLRTRDAKQ